MAHQCFMEMDVSAARLAQSAERKALNLVVVGWSPTVGDLLAKRKECEEILQQKSALLFSTKPPPLHHDTWRQASSSWAKLGGAKTLKNPFRSSSPMLEAWWA